ncbi:MAG: sulfite exporter TauE/SafE family protein [Phycisphaerae bacterium]|nr:sulfite exporter TauE/SafE family protein [Phycisphaerae bacterium]
MSGFLLGLSLGAACLASCAPILVPWYLAQAAGWGRNFVLLGLFSAGRLVGYGVFGILAWIIHPVIDSLRHSFVFGLIYLALGIMLIHFGRTQFHNPCVSKGLMRRIPAEIFARPGILAVIMGVLVGLNLCPPFLAAFTKAAETPSLAASVIFFVCFWAGTTVYLLPLPMVGLFRQPVAAIVGRFACWIMAGYFIYQGVLIWVGGLK